LVKKQSLGKEELALLAGLNGKMMTLPLDNGNWPSKQLISERNKKGNQAPLGAAYL
jgi:hypothetical protein